MSNLDKLTTLSFQCCIHVFSETPKACDAHLVDNDKSMKNDV